ncbi:uncharacterized protein CELE_W02B8.1 [Caenorhabditis elegans]|uniref:Uncharacterized protein n=1 Tax=Caenorhabditis elegans TaxID=6239 RepID=K8FE07_CAEEL|nr:Uncharacterized protein CELE_W02B8.1 [Caenorhabditis elegans]CCO25897.1 Uncharacterized protein CELE_W02B8.1 [Caenorhabditis elegans]|eukprot:NP_496913.2 Uncharacterized protein CELE_W02B8.1 [Caenorhabditis elegans]
MSPNLFAREDPSESRNIFVLGICVLFGWMIVILICASPHLFRNYLKKWFKHDEDPLTDKIRKAEARLQETLRLAQKPSNFLVDQAAVMSTMAVRPEKSETRITLGLVEEEDEDECT